MRGMSNRDAAARGLLGGTVMDEVKARREAEAPVMAERELVPQPTQRSAPAWPPSRAWCDDFLVHCVDRTMGGPVFRREDIERAMVLPEGTKATYLSIPGWENPKTVEPGQIWEYLGDGAVSMPANVVHTVAPPAAGPGDLAKFHSTPGGNPGWCVSAAKMLSHPGWRCVGFELPSGERVMVGEVRLNDFTDWTIASIKANACVRLTTRRGSEFSADTVVAVSGWPLEADATRRAIAEREGAPTLPVRAGGVRVIGWDLARPGELDRTGIVVGRYAGEIAAPTGEDHRDIVDALALSLQGISVVREDPEGRRWIENVSGERAGHRSRPGSPLVTPEQHARLLADLAAGPHGPGFAGPHVEAESPPRDSAIEARGLCLGIPWMSGETDRAYAARLDVEEARQVAQKILPDLARPIPFRAALSIPFEASLFTSPTAKEIRYLADAIQHLEAELSRGMRDARAVEEALAGFRWRTQHTGPGWLRPALDRYVAERARGGR